MIAPILPTTGNPPPAAGAKDKIANAARDFEALLIEQMLRTSRETASGSLDGESDAARDMALEMADQQVAKLIAARGGLGMAAVVTKNVKPALAPAPTVR